jgi:ActR/RegA family two-component response regulator
MGSDENVLIVEDEDEWCRNYERAMSSVRREQTVKVAKNLAGAEQLIASTKFAVAFVDVGLDVSDDQNVDGLRVMQRIRDTNDETSIVVVTGRSGQDVLPIIRDAIKKYGAHDVIGKSAVRPSDIRRLLEGGLEEYRSKAASGRTAARDSIRGTADPMIWDHQATHTINFKGSVNSFYDFLDQLFGEYLPLVPQHDAADARVDRKNGIVYGQYWSRAVAEGLLICFGSEATFDEALTATGGDASVVGNTAPVKELASHGVRGAVFILEGSRRGEFRPGY